jgi:hypothetical protein
VRHPRLRAQEADGLCVSGGGSGGSGRGGKKRVTARGGAACHRCWAGCLATGTTACIAASFALCVGNFAIFKLLHRCVAAGASQLSWLEADLHPLP